MALQPTIRPANVAVLWKLESTEGVDANPSPTTDAIPVEADSVTKGNPWTTEASNEATGSWVGGAPLVIGQPVTISFRFRVKGAGAGSTYSASIKPPHHSVYQAAGWRGQFTAAIATQLATAGGATQATLGASYSAIARAIVGMPLSITAGVGNGAMPLVTEYTSGKVATLSESFSPVLDTTTSVALPANWTYSRTSPSTTAAETADQPSATSYLYISGVLWKIGGIRGTLSLDGQNARPGYATFNGTGILLGRSDAAVPTNLVIANHQAPVLVQGTGVSPAVQINRLPLAIATWSLDPGSQLQNVDDPNTTYGFGAPKLAERVPMLKVDPFATLIANRDTITDIGNGTRSIAAFRHGTVAGNRWSMLIPQAQPTDTTDGTRDRLATEEITFQCLANGPDANTRDVDVILCFS